MKKKSEVFCVFKKFKTFVEKKNGCNIKVMRSNRGDKIVSKEFEDIMYIMGLVNINSFIFSTTKWSN